MENAPKLTLTEYEFLKNEVAKTIRDDSQYRLGQAWFNELVSHLPQFGWIRATDLDPFHRDEVLLDLFFHILDEEAYASWTHSDNYKRLHKEWTDKHPAVAVDTSGSELSEYLEGEDTLEWPQTTVNVRVGLNTYDSSSKRMRRILCSDRYEKPSRYANTSGSELSSFLEANDEAEFQSTPIPFKELKTKLMENTQFNIVDSNETTPLITNNSTSTATITLNPGAAIGYNPGLLQSNSVTGQGLVYSGNYEPKIEETTNVRLNITTHRSPLECVELLKQISDMLGTLEDIRVRNLEISQW